MPFFVEKNDITKFKCDAIVNAANCTLLGGGGVDGAIHAATGPELLDECIKLGGCNTGEAKITKGYNLPSKYVIHTVGPIWSGGENGEEMLLRSCYRNSLQLAAEHKCRSVAFPLISAGAYGYPKRDAYLIAKDEIKSFVFENDITVYMILFGDLSFLDNDYSRDLQHYLEFKDRLQDLVLCNPCPESCDFTLDEGFREYLLRMIDERNMADADCYKKANIDRKLFNKIINNPDYHISKRTAVSLSFALELSYSETQDFLEKLGYTLSRSILYDSICSYYISRGVYDFTVVNDTLTQNGLPCLGSRT